MTSVFPSFGNTKYVVNHLADDCLVDEQTVAVSDVGGIVTATWTLFTCTIDGLTYSVAAGTKDFNAGAVATPTTYYLYFVLVAGVPTATVSTTNPCINPALTTGYFITNILRFSSIGGVVTYYIAKYPTQNGLEDLAHNLKEDSMYFQPQWISGIAPTFTAATGKLSTASGYVRFPGNQPRAQAAITNGSFILDDESAIVTDLTGLTTYADGSAVTANKWVKFLVGVNRDKGGILSGEYLVMRQSKPGTEYASAAEAKADAENKAQSGFGVDYLAACTPICYITGQVVAGPVVDFTAGEVVDIRATGTTRGSGGGASVVSHGALANLNVVADHPGYVTLDGTRPLTANWDAGSFNVKAETLTSDVGIGTPPLVITSTDRVANLNADTVDGIQGANIVTADGLTALTGNWSAGDTRNIQAKSFTSAVAIGTAPFTSTSTTMCTNVNADAVDGIQGANIVTADGLTALSGNWAAAKNITTVGNMGCAAFTASGLSKALTFESTQGSGTAPMVVASNTLVSNLNADLLDGNEATAFAVAAKGVTNGDTHNHVGGDGGQIAHANLSGLTAPADDHTQYLLADGTRALSDNWVAGVKNITTTGAISGSTLVATLASGGAAPMTITSTTKVTNLNADMLDGLHDTSFLKADGSVNLAGNLAVDGTYTIDGVDISAHATNASAHHAPVTISDDLNNALLALNTQALDLDTQTATYAFMGPASGAAAKPTFRAILPADIRRTEGVLTLSNGQNNNVTLSDGVDQYIVAGPTGAFGIGGMTGGYAGRRVVIANINIAKNMTAYHENGSSTAANRIICPGGNTDVATTSYGLMEFEYFGTTGRWMLKSIIT